MITATEFNQIKQNVYEVFAKKINEKALDRALYDNIYTAYEQIKDAEKNEDIDENTVGALIDLILSITDFPKDALLKENKDLLIQLQEQIATTKKDYEKQLLELNSKKDLLREERKEKEAVLKETYEKTIFNYSLQQNKIENAIELLESNITYLSPNKAKNNLNSFKLITLELLQYYINSQTFIDAGCKGACLGSCLTSSSSKIN